tara:strand:- start:172 stop:474 length:303 start_codon:yes stop_codon:yes gene_type:complete
MDQWSDFDKYIVLADNASDSLYTGFEPFLEFKRVVDALKVISKTDGTNYYFGSTMYPKPISSTRARTILDGINLCKYDSKILTVAKQIGVRIGSYKQNAK